jgi:hypothetical protein
LPGGLESRQGAPVMNDTAALALLFFTLICGLGCGFIAAVLT